MKALIALLTFSASVASAQSCLGEAQIIAKAESARFVDGACLVKIAPSSIRFFAENQLCPLSYGDIVGRSVVMSRASVATCKTASNSEISGVIVLDSAGTLTLE